MSLKNAALVSIIYRWVVIELQKDLRDRSLFISRRSGKKVGGVMTQMEIDRGGSLLFWLNKHGGSLCFLIIHYRSNLFACKNEKIYSAEKNVSLSYILPNIKLSLYINKYICMEYIGTRLSDSLHYSSRVNPERQINT